MRCTEVGLLSAQPLAALRPAPLWIDSTPPQVFRSKAKSVSTQAADEGGPVTPKTPTTRPLTAQPVGSLTHELLRSRRRPGIVKTEKHPNPHKVPKRQLSFSTASSTLGVCRCLAEAQSLDRDDPELEAIQTNRTAQPAPATDRAPAPDAVRMREGHAPVTCLPSPPTLLAVPRPPSHRHLRRPCAALPGNTLPVPVAPQPPSPQKTTLRLGEGPSAFVRPSALVASTDH